MDPKEHLSSWSLHIDSFWKIHFINPPEVRGQVLRLLAYGQDVDDTGESKSPMWAQGQTKKFKK
jgi:hypothetical protein